MNLVSSVENNQRKAAHGILDRFSSPGRNIHSPGHHAWKTTAPTLFPDERRPFTVTCDGTVNLRRISTGFRLHPSATHSSGVVSASLSADGNRLLTVSTNQDLRMWDIETGKGLWSLGPVAAAAFGPCSWKRFPRHVPFAGGFSFQSLNRSAVGIKNTLSCPFM